jgi:MYXO-CTERM domain-containing protein
MTRILWKNEIVQGGMQNGRRVYFNQPQIVKIADNRLALQAIESNGMGKNTNVKGANTAHLYMLERNGDNIIRAGEITGAAAHQTHAGLCAGNYGEQGAPAVAVFSAAPTGIGRAAMVMLNYEEATKSFKYDPKGDLWPVAWYGDSGHLSNWYGRNPMNQGRDFLRCIGGVPNPGYHVANGFMADVKTFFVAPVHGRVPGDEKNSLFLSFVPGQMDKKPLPQNPVVAGADEGLGEVLPPEDKPKDSGGCGCSTPGETSNNGPLALLAVAGLGAIVSMRRRRR